MNGQRLYDQSSLKELANFLFLLVFEAFNVMVLPSNIIIFCHLSLETFSSLIT